MIYFKIMKKKLLLLCITISCLSQLILAAPAPMSIIVQSQYETAFKSDTITVVSTGEKFVTDKKGHVTINASTGDFIKVSHKDFDTAAVSLRTIDRNNVVKVKKNFSWIDLVTPMFYIVNGGLWLIIFIIFAETGLFAGFFLPGDSLLFVAGIYNAELVESIFPFVHNEYIQLLVLWLLISVAGIIGNSVGYWFGRKVGPAMYSWKDNFIFKQKYLHDAHEFYEKHGGGAIIFARFLPIVRTFAPIVAGIVGMEKKKFTFFNIIGSFAWVLSMLVAGHFLQKWVLSQFGFNLKERLEIIVVGIVLVTTAPVLIKLFFGKKKNQ
jgi:membrane-associated protein